MKLHLILFLTIITGLYLPTNAQQNSQHVFSDFKKDTGQDYHADPRNDEHITTKVIKEVKLTPEQAKQAGITASSPHRGMRVTGKDTVYVPDTILVAADTPAAIHDTVQTAGSPVAPMNNDGYRNMNMHTGLTFISIFSLLAILGMFLIIIALGDKNRPHSKTIVYGIFAVALVTGLVMYAVHHCSLAFAIVSFVIATISAGVLIYDDMNNKPLPNGLAIAQAVVGILTAIGLAIMCFTM